MGAALLPFPKLRTFVVTLALGLAGIGALAQTTCTTNDSTAPCLANNRDILNGQRSLLEDDDLFLGGNLGSNDPSGFSSNSTVFVTTNSVPSTLYTGNQYPGSTVSSNTIVQAARMFDQVPAVAVSGFASFGPQGNGSVQTLYNLQNAIYEQINLFQGLGITNGCDEKLYSVAADFTGSGADDIVYGLYTPGCISGGSGMTFQAIAANDSAYPALGFKTGSPSSLFTSQSSLYALAAGTFSDPAPTGAPPLPQIAQLTTIYNTGLGLEIGLFAVDPATLAVTYTGKFVNLTLPEGDSANIAALAISAGRFSGANHDQLLVAYTVLGGTAKIITVDFDTNGNPIQEQNGSAYDTKVSFTANSGGGLGYPAGLVLQKGRFNFFGAADQAALSRSWPGQRHP